MSVQKLDCPYCVVAMDDPSKPVEVNELFLHMLGYTMEEYERGKVDFESLVSAEDMKGVHDVWRNIQGNTCYVRHNMIKKDGTVIFVDCIQTMFERDGKTLIAVACSDYSQQKELARKGGSYRKELDILTSEILGGVSIIYADDFSIYRCNNEFRRMLDVPEGEDVPPFLSFSTQQERSHILEIIDESIRNDTPVELELKIKVNGSDKWLLFVGRPFDKVDGRVLLYTVAYDMTHEKKMFSEIEMQAARYRFITKSIDYIFIDYDVQSDTLQFSNAINRYGDSVVEEYVGKHKSYDYIYPDDISLFKNSVNNFLSRPYSGEFEFRTKSFDDDYTWYKLSLTSVADHSMKVSKVYGVMNNIQEIKKMSKRLEMDNDYINYLITTDSVTGMLNYKTFVSKAEELLRNYDRSYIYGFVYSDINGFSYVNDNLGFEAGNKMLRDFGQIINDLPTNVLACRIYSDYFVGLYRARTVSELISSLNSRNKDFYKKQQELIPGSNLNICAGLYIWEDGIDVSRAVFNANLARKSIKGVSHGDCGVYEPQMHIKRAREQKIANELNSAITSGLIEMFLQPKFSMETMEVIGAEALARWRNVDGTYIMPGEFIAVLEKVGYIDELDFYIYEQVLHTLVDWKNGGKRMLPISVNFSRQHVRRADYVDKIISMAKEHGVDPEYIEIEITESCFGDDLEKLFSDMSKLQEAGFRIDIDDFGVSYSTLGVLLNAPVDMVKIDKSFIDNITTNDKERLYVKNICQLISTMDKDLIFEGVETKEQAQILCEIGYTKAQGWLFDKALPLSVFNEKYMK